MKNFDQVKKFIISEFLKIKYEVEFFDESNNSLLKNCTKNINLPFYQYSRYQYEKEYLKIPKEHDFSFFLKQNNQVIALWYLMLTRKDTGLYKLYSLGVDESVKQPFFFNISKKNQGKLIDFSINLLLALKKKLNLKEIILTDYVSNNKLSRWGRELAKLCSQSKINIIFINEISRINENNAKKIIEKNKNFINVDNNNNQLDKLWSQFQKLHKKKSGRLTRTLQSWEFQKKMILNKEASLYGYVDKSNLLAGIFIYYSKSVAFYSVGVLGQVSNINNKLFKFASACLKKINIEKLILGIQDTNIKEKKYLQICESNKRRSDYQEPLLMFSL